jgi:hypothetical protein
MDSTPHIDLIRRLIEARTCYENLCGTAPTCVHVNGSMLRALAAKGFKEGASVAGMKIIARTGPIADPAICSRDEGLFRCPA